MKIRILKSGKIIIAIVLAFLMIYNTGCKKKVKEPIDYLIESKEGTNMRAQISRNSECCIINIFLEFTLRETEH